MSARGSTAKISSLSSMSPPLPASRVCTLTFILAFLAFVGVGGRLDAVLRRAGLFVFCSLGRIGGFNFGRLGGFGFRSRAGLLLSRDRRDFGIAWQRRDIVNRRIVDQPRLGNFELLNLTALEDARRIRRGLRARKLDRVADGQPAALVAGDRALDE